MHVVEGININSVACNGIKYLLEKGYKRDSRNGPVLLAPGPVTSVYLRPEERVLFWPKRDANPFLHLFESLWMLAGRNDVAFPAQFAAQMKEYSDDGVAMNGAYGYRWLWHFRKDPDDAPAGARCLIAVDQLGIIIERLKKDPNDRRCVLGMWDPAHDLGLDSKDLPCNTHIYFLVNPHGLDMTVCNRSNDIIWGAYGANVVHFSMLHEYMARAIGVPVGVYYQMSNNYHMYLNTFEPLAGEFNEKKLPIHDLYQGGLALTYPLMSVEKQTWDEDLSVFMDQGPITGFREPFFRKIATPMWHAHKAWKANKGKEKYLAPLEIIEQMPENNDWRLAAGAWLNRRYNKWRIAADDGAHS